MQDATAILEQLDRQLLLLINGAHTPWQDSFFWSITQPWSWIPFYLTCVWLLWVCYRRQFLKPLLFLVLAILLANFVTSDILKPCVARLRPTHTPGLVEQLHLHLKPNGRYYYGGLYGFCSSHAANNTAIALLSYLLMRKQTIRPRIYASVWIVAVTLISYSRVYLCAHYPIDILGGVLSGIAVSLLLYHIFQHYWAWSNKINPIFAPHIQKDQTI